MSYQFCYVIITVYVFNFVNNKVSFSSKTHLENLKIHNSSEEQKFTMYVGNISDIFELRGNRFVEISGVLFFFLIFSMFLKSK